MKFILNKDTLEIENIEVVKSGSVNYYEADVEYDESWNGLAIEAVMLKKDEDAGKSVAVINNKMYIDQKLRGTYCIGFVGYKIEEEKKVYQVSTNLQKIYFDLGAGEIETENEELPTPSEWEIYIAQIQEMLKNAGGGTGGIAEETDPTVPQHVKNITEEDIENWNNKSYEGGAKEIYIGADEPTGKEVIWIDTTEEADKIPTKTSELENDSGFITEIPDIPTKVSQLENDSNFITEIPQEYAKKTDIPDVSRFITKDVTELTNYYDKDDINSLVGNIETLLGGI